jgi:hypothetical protein
MRSTFDTSGVTLKIAQPDDQPMVDVLAELDSAPPLTGRSLLAFVDGWPVAALSLHDQRVVANPFAPSAEAVDLLRIRARQLSPAARRRRPMLRRVRRLRLA